MIKVGITGNKLFCHDDLSGCRRETATLQKCPELSYLNPASLALAYCHNAFGLTFSPCSSRPAAANVPELLKHIRNLMEIHQHVWLGVLGWRSLCNTMYTEAEIQYNLFNGFRKSAQHRCIILFQSSKGHPAKQGAWTSCTYKNVSCTINNKGNILKLWG